MVRSDPFTPESKTFECPSCCRREGSADAVPSCPDCGRTMRNIAVPRE